MQISNSYIAQGHVWRSRSWVRVKVMRWKCSFFNRGCTWLCFCLSSSSLCWSGWCNLQWELSNIALVIAHLSIAAGRCQGLLPCRHLCMLLSDYAVQTWSVTLLCYCFWFLLTGLVDGVTLGIFLSSIFTCPYFLFSLCFCSTYLLVYFLTSLSTASRIDPFRFQAGARMRWPNLAIVFLH